eukprot:jgi/Picsp_1/2399/NSC_05860-R1_expressed protein [Chlorella variabilis]
MVSESNASIKLKSWKPTLPPCSADLGFRTVLRKKIDDGSTISFSFDESTLKDPSSKKGAVISVEKSLTDESKLSFQYDLGKKVGMSSIAVRKSISNSQLLLKATYKTDKTSLVLDETFEINKNNKITGQYNFANEEAVFAYTYLSGDWNGTAKYNFQKDSSTYSIVKRQGKSKISVSYSPRSEDITFAWSKRPYTIRMKGSSGMSGVSLASVDLNFIHDFDV